MKSTTMQRLAAILGVVAMVVACSDLPVVPIPHAMTEATSASLDTRARSRERVPVLQRGRPLRELQTTTVVVGPGGGEIALPRSGFRMLIPAGAVEASTAISVTAYEGRAVAYEFGPHGLQFRAPVIIEQSLDGTTAEYDWRLRARLLAGYSERGTASIDDATGTAEISELMPSRLTDDFTSLSFEIMHFSGYIIATGRSTTSTDSTGTRLR